MMMYHMLKQTHIKRWERTVQTWWFNEFNWWVINGCTFNGVFCSTFLMNYTGWCVCNTLYTLNTLHCILYTVYSILYTIHFIMDNCLVDLDVIEWNSYVWIIFWNFDPFRFVLKVFFVVVFSPVN